MCVCRYVCVHVCVNMCVYECVCVYAGLCVCGVCVRGHLGRGIVHPVMVSGRFGVGGYHTHQMLVLGGG